uniref:Tudor domain-containing protein n=1 Tax=Steinernema glaseri TaxID=37863 RepID=A0A1I7Y1J9_9BILA
MMRCCKSRTADLLNLWTFPSPMTRQDGETMPLINLSQSKALYEYALLAYRISTSPRCVKYRTLQLWTSLTALIWPEWMIYFHERIYEPCLYLETSEILPQYAHDVSRIFDAAWCGVVRTARVAFGNYQRSGEASANFTSPGFPMSTVCLPWVCLVSSHIALKMASIVPSFNSIPFSTVCCLRLQAHSRLKHRLLLLRALLFPSDSITMSAEDLANYKLQLQQVEAALLGEPDNEDYKTLKRDLEEVIAITEDMLNQDNEASASSEPQTSIPPEPRNSAWKVGQRCLAPSKNGQKFPAVIDGISNDKVAVTFMGTGVKSYVKIGELSDPPVEVKKNYIFDNKSNNNSMKKNEWHAEKERRKLRAQKKEVRRKALDAAKEGQKNAWQQFNNKAKNKGMKGLKRVTASGSAADGPSGRSLDRPTNISSRQDTYAFRSTSRGNMDSLF